MMSEKRMPRCLGAFEADDPQCDGNPVGKTLEDQAPCVYRDRCAGFVELMKETQRPREYFVRTIQTHKTPQSPAVPYTFANNDEFEELVNGQIVKHGIQYGRKNILAPKVKVKVSSKKPAKVTQLRKPSKPVKATYKAGGKALANLANEGRERSKEVGVWLAKRIAGYLGRKVATFEESAKPGELFLVDRLETSSYCALYCKARGRRIAIASYTLKPLKAQIEVRLALDYKTYVLDHIASSALKRLQPLDHTGKDGAFKVRIQGVDTELASLVAETLRKADAQGAFGFPEVDT